MHCTLIDRLTEKKNERKCKKNVTLHLFSLVQSINLYMYTVCVLSEAHFRRMCQIAIVLFLSTLYASMIIIRMIKGHKGLNILEICLMQNTILNSLI